ncbi:SixA phosphatase family protein [Nisaea sp.]|uniref:SixA phosphatase family protein n=1 Tax=Nisaea sp. TaxID=2024842 RepID=UPI003B51F869
MTKSLILLRHAKSSWDQPSLDDFDRPLNQRGERAALLIGHFLRQESVAPDIVLCSAARRTRQTWEIIRPFLQPDTECLKSEAIYEADLDRLLEVLSDLDNALGSVLMIGHNPGLERLASALCHGRRGDELERLQQKFPTGGLAFIEVNINLWSELAPATGELIRFVTPKDLV